MTTNQRRLIAVAAVMALTFGIVPVSNAMHIMEGFLAQDIALFGVCSVFPSLLRVFFP